MSGVDDAAGADGAGRTEAPVTAVRTAAYRVPTETVEADGTLRWHGTTVVVAVVEAAGGNGHVTGTGWTYAHRACAEVIEDVLAPLVVGWDLFDVRGAWQAMQRAIRNLGRPGLVSCAMSAVEVALWDAAARSVGLPLSRMLGRVREEIPVYGSGGFTSYDDEQLRGQLRRWTEDQRMPAVKIKVGESWGGEPSRDLHRVDLARQIVGDDVELCVDANGAYSAAQAIRIGRAYDDLGVHWYEEPVSSDDLAGLRDVRERVMADVTAGEYGYHLPYFAGMLDAEAVDCLQVDLTRCGGIGEWQRAAALAAARNLDVSAHGGPNLSAHVALATPNVRHLEWFHDHERVDAMLLDGTLDPTGGTVRPDPNAPGHGMTLKEEDAERFRVDRSASGEEARP